jgi:hypothetical protein
VKSTFQSHTFGGHTFASGTWRGVGVPIDPEPATCAVRNMLAWGAAALSATLQAHASEPVIYRRGGQAVALCATPGQTLLRLSDEFGGTRIEWTDQDFIIPRSALVLGGNATLPRRGDRIEREIGGELHVFEVRPYGPDEPQWRWSDRSRTIVRIHAKRLTTEAT